MDVYAIVPDSMTGKVCVLPAVEAYLEAVGTAVSQASGGSSLSNDPMLAQQLWELSERLLKGSDFGVGLT
jgi:hypothetical protein